MSRTCIQTTDLHACINTDRGRRDGWTNEPKENIQTDRETNNVIQKYVYTRTDGHIGWLAVLGLTAL